MTAFKLPSYLIVLEDSAAIFAVVVHFALILVDDGCANAAALVILVLLIMLIAPVLIFVPINISFTIYSDDGTDRSEKICGSQREDRYEL
ncbi:Hypothetical predicted protein [Octopus vulgaris]|uniref:Uncharacterized protein n=1 Tax=Octopus vulgaris TaxID=6645 RepID=A0AA36BJX7_OCTVU|nr:Hypothetical predicted protein [Octopus vulgaris]